MAATVRLISVGKIKERYILDGISEYKKRLSGYVRLEMADVPDESIPNDPSPAEVRQILDKEGQRVKKLLKKDEIVILLDLDGRQWSSEELSDQLKKLVISGRSHIAFVIGGSLGVSAELRDLADYRWCLSPLTFPHQMVRLIVLEQIYRACRISRGERYHR